MALLLVIGDLGNVEKLLEEATLSCEPGLVEVGKIFDYRNRVGYWPRWIGHDSIHSGASVSRPISSGGVGEWKWEKVVIYSKWGGLVVIMVLLLLPPMLVFLEGKRIDYFVGKSAEMRRWQ